MLRRVLTLSRRLGFWMFLFSGGLLVYGFDPETDGMQGIKELVRKRFPEVRQLQPAELAEWLNDTNRQPPLILDVREAKEFKVSHLADAQNVDPDSKPSDLEAKTATNRPVVVYCSVGYRSSALAQRLIKSGYTNVYNLEGSIFQWANEGHEVVNEKQEAVKKVHPYNKRWGVLLKPELRAEE